jgi:hypothetical protein
MECSVCESGSVNSQLMYDHSCNWDTFFYKTLLLHNLDITNVLLKQNLGMLPLKFLFLHNLNLIPFFRSFETRGFF